MKLTKSKLKRIIKEELDKVLLAEASEATAGYAANLLREGRAEDARRRAEDEYWEREEKQQDVQRKAAKAFLKYYNNVAKRHNSQGFSKDATAASSVSLLPSGFGQLIRIAARDPGTGKNHNIDLSENTDWALLKLVVLTGLTDSFAETANMYRMLAADKEGRAQAARDTGDEEEYWKKYSDRAISLYKLLATKFKQLDPKKQEFIIHSTYSDNDPDQLAAMDAKITAWRAKKASGAQKKETDVDVKNKGKFTEFFKPTDEGIKKADGRIYIQKALANKVIHQVIAPALGDKKPKEEMDASLEKAFRLTRWLTHPKVVVARGDDPVNDYKEAAKQALQAFKTKNWKNIDSELRILVYNLARAR